MQVGPRSFLAMGVLAGVFCETERALWSAQVCQWVPKALRNQIPRGVRGVYALHGHDVKLDKYDVVYIGMTSVGRRGSRSRLASHARSKRKGSRWSQFSFFEVWPNLTPEEIEELEGLFREIYRQDARANWPARQKRYKKRRIVRVSHQKIARGALAS
jgi:hypothetical protein